MIKKVGLFTSILCFCFIGCLTVFAQTRSRSAWHAQREAEYPRIAKAVQLDGYKYIVGRGMKKFIEEVNEAGKKGYRLQSVTTETHWSLLDYITLAAVMKLDEGSKYEYDWFEADDPTTVVTRIGYRAKRGFYFKDYIWSWGGAPPSGDSVVSDLLFGTGGFWFEHIFLLERKEGFTPAKLEHRVALAANLRLGKNGVKELEQQLATGKQLGFRPVIFFSGHFYAAILLENLGGTEPDEGLQRADFKVIRSWWRGVEDKVNQAAESGYRLLSFETFSAVMVLDQRASEAKVSYSWTNADKRSFETQLQALSNSNYRFEKTYYYGDYIERDLIFSKLAGDRRRYELKVVKIPRLNDLTESDKMEKSQEWIKEFNEAINSGFVFRDLFASNKHGASALFERPVNLVESTPELIP